jgi:hypothetical protein
MTDDDDVPLGRRIKRRQSEAEVELARRVAKVARRVGRRDGVDNRVVVRHVPPWSLKPGGRPGKRG